MASVHRFPQSLFARTIALEHRVHQTIESHTALSVRWPRVARKDFLQRRTPPSSTFVIGLEMMGLSGVMWKVGGLTADWMLVVADRGERLVWGRIKVCLHLATGSAWVFRDSTAAACPRVSCLSPCPRGSGGHQRVRGKLINRTAGWVAIAPPTGVQSKVTS